MGTSDEVMVMEGGEETSELDDIEYDEERAQERAQEIINRLGRREISCGILE